MSQIKPKQTTADDQIISYMIYNPIYRQIKKYIKRHGFRKYIINTWNVWLYARETTFSMKLVWMNGASQEFRQFMSSLENDLEFFWEKRPTLSIQRQHFEQFKEFIEKNQLWTYVEKIVTKLQIALIDTEIKVITFHPKIRATHILDEYKRLISLNDPYSNNTLNISSAYEWLKPKALQHFAKKPLTRFNWHLAVYLLLDYYRTILKRRKRRVLSIADLCAIRLALYDPRYYQFNQCELPALIHEAIQIAINEQRNGNSNYELRQLDILVNEGGLPIRPTVSEYFSYYIVGYEDDLVLPPSEMFTLRIRDYKDYLQTLNVSPDVFYMTNMRLFAIQRSFSMVIVDCQSVKMSPYLIREILGIRSVCCIILDTDQPLQFDSAELVRPNDKIEKQLNVEFVGKNHRDHLEKYVELVRSYLTFRKFKITVKCPISNYTIFNNVPADAIIFWHCELNANVISELWEEGVMSKYSFRESRLENNNVVFGLLCEWPLIEAIEILQDEFTFEMILRYAEELFKSTESVLVKIKKPITVKTINSPDRFIMPRIDKHGFILNQDKTKIEIVHLYSNRIVDLFELLNGSEVNEADTDMVYEFYQ